MLKYSIIGLLVAFLALLSSNDAMIIIVFGVISIPVLLALNWAFCSALRLMTVFKKKAEILCMIPSLLFAAWFFWNLSSWRQPYIGFELLLKSTAPASVSNLHYKEMAWTDFIAQLYCKIDSDDLHTIIQNSPLVLVEAYSNEIDFQDSYIEEIRNLSPLKDIVQYSYRIDNKTEGRLPTVCDLYTNPDHNIIYVRYMTE